MRHLRRHRPSPAMVVATLALVAALGGTAFAGPVARLAASIDGRSVRPNTLPGDRVIKQSLPGAAIAHGAIAGNLIRHQTIPGATIEHNAIAGDLVRHDTLTGYNINESTLGTVPSASTVGGLNVKKFFAKQGVNTAPAPVATVGGVTIIAGCDASGNPSLVAQTSANNSVIRGEAAQTAYGNGNFVSGVSQNLRGTAQRGSGSFTYTTPSGSVVSAQYQFSDSPSVGAFAGCVSSGTLIGG